MSDKSKYYTPRYVTKRDGSQEIVDLTKIDARLNYLCSKPYQLKANASYVAQTVRDQVVNGIETRALDEYAMKVCANLAAFNPEYLKLAARIAVDNHQKNTNDCFSGCVETCFRNKKIVGKKKRSVNAPRVNARFYKFVQIHKAKLNAMIDYDRDFDFTYFGFTTLIDRYLLKRSGPRKAVEIRPQDYAIERPQDMWMRVAVAIHMNRQDLNDDSVLPLIKETYDLLSMGLIMHATPTLYNAGTECEQFLSCFLCGGEDSIEGIARLNGNLMKISKYSGGIGFWWDLRSDGSEVQKTNGISNGPIPFLRGIASYMEAVNQGGKRPGSAANYMEPAHPDFLKWAKLKRDGEIDGIQTLFYGMWTPDIFMRYVVADKDWYFVDPHDHPHLYTLYGAEYDVEYERIIAEGEYVGEPVPARDVLMTVCETQCETGMPYMLYKDACNQKSNQKHYAKLPGKAGGIKSSNLCVAGDTPILTAHGWVDIDKLEDQVIPVWNGIEFSDALVKRTSESAQLWEIETSDGCILRCTPEHEFIIPEGARNQKTKKISANKLVIGQKLAKIPDLPIIMVDASKFPYAYTAGFFTGDGTYCNDTDIVKDCGYKAINGGSYCGRHQDWCKPTDHNVITCCAKVGHPLPRIELYGEKQKLVNELQHIGEPVVNGDKLVIRLPIDMPKKFTVPMDYRLDSKLAWLAGLIDSDGTLASGSIQISSIDQDFLVDVKLMCQTMGINPIVSTMHEAGRRQMPDGKGGKKFYDCKKSYRLLISGWDTWKLYNDVQLGLNTHRVKYTVETKPNRDARGFVTISSMKILEKPEPTWCFGEPKRNAGMFGGLLTGQCAEILEYSDADEYACCCVSSVCLPKFVIECDCATNMAWLAGKIPAGSVAGHQQGCNGHRRMDYDRLHYCAGVLINNLNKIIDINFYPVEEARRSNMLHRPLALGVQGFHDELLKLKYPFTGVEARLENKRTFETIYHGAVERSWKLARDEAKLRGDDRPFAGAYPTFEGSPFSKGELQFDMWGLTNEDLMGRWDWDSTKENVVKYGTANSLLTSLPPTASTSHIQGNSECYEPIMDNVYTRKTLSGEFIIINNYLVDDLQERGLWTVDLRERLIEARGSVQTLDIPADLKELYKTAWELDGPALVDMDADRAPFVDQTQSSNRFMLDPNPKKLFGLHVRTWRKKLKTGMYYLRSQSGSKAKQFSQAISTAKAVEEEMSCELKKVNGVMCYSCT